MKTTILNRAVSTAYSTLPNNRRMVSEMDDDQRKAVMAKIGGSGYSGSARGGGSSMRKQRAKFARLSHEMELRRQGQIGLQSDLTPIDLLASTAIESGLEGISQARMNTDNKWVDAALGVAALGLFAAGVKNARSQKAMTKHLSAQKNFEQVLEQMGRDAERFNPLLSPKQIPAPSSAGEEVYRRYDKIAERLTRARGYPPTSAEANAWLDKAAPRVEIPASRAGDVFRAEAAKATGSQRGQYLDYARRADMEAIAPRTVRDPWTSISSTVSDLRSQYGIGNRATIDLFKRSISIAFAPDEILANAGPISDDQRKAMFAKMSGPGRRATFASPGRGTVSTRTSTSSYNLPMYTRPDLNRIDQGIGLPGSERPTRTIDFARFDSLLENFKNTFPQEQGGIAMQMDSVLRPFRDNPTAFFDDPKAVDQLFNLVARSIVGNTGSKNYETKRGALESSFYSEGLKILQAAGLMPGWKAHSTFGQGGYPGVRFWNERPSSPQFYSSDLKIGPTSSISKQIKSSVSSGGTSTGRSGSSLSQAPRTPSGGYAPRQSYPGGPVFYGPKPGEQGYIDIGQWRSGAQPKIHGKPVSPPVVDRYKKNRSTFELVSGHLAIANAGPLSEQQRKAMFASKGSLASGGSGRGRSSGSLVSQSKINSVGNVSAHAARPGPIPTERGKKPKQATAEIQFDSGKELAAKVKEDALAKLASAQKLLQSIPLDPHQIPSQILKLKGSQQHRNSPGFIDFDAWRRGALPKIPGKPWINNKPELGVAKPL